MYFDDGSTDKTLEILQQIKEITIIFTKQNNGLSEVFNRIANYSRENNMTSQLYLMPIVVPTRRD